MTWKFERPFAEGTSPGAVVSGVMSGSGFGRGESKGNDGLAGNGNGQPEGFPVRGEAEEGNFLGRGAATSQGYGESYGYADGTAWGGGFEYEGYGHGRDDVVEV